MLFVDRSRGFGFVIFTSPDALDSVQAARPHEIDGRVVDTKRALPKSVSSRGIVSLMCNVSEVDDFEAVTLYVFCALFVLDVWISRHINVMAKDHFHHLSLWHNTVRAGPEQVTSMCHGPRFKS